MVVILGPNGHGKTTLLLAISGLLSSLAGEIEFEGTRITGMTGDQTAALGIIHVPQGDLIFPEMTVLQNLFMGAYLAWGERHERVEQVYTLFPRLQERQSQMARSLSGGERRMLALGRGLMRRAPLLMVDEPSQGLAPLVIEEVYSAIREIKATGVSILLVDENADHIRGLADRVYILESGYLVREGTADEILSDVTLLATYLG